MLHTHTGHRQVALTESLPFDLIALRYTRKRLIESLLEGDYDTVTSIEKTRDVMTDNNTSKSHTHATPRDTTLHQSASISNSITNTTSRKQIPLEDLLPTGGVVARLPTRRLRMARSAKRSATRGRVSARGRKSGKAHSGGAGGSPPGRGAVLRCLTQRQVSTMLGKLVPADNQPWRMYFCCCYCGGDGQRTWLKNIESMSYMYITHSYVTYMHNVQNTGLLASRHRQSLLAQLHHRGIHDLYAAVKSHTQHAQHARPIAGGAGTPISAAKTTMKTQIKAAARTSTISNGGTHNTTPTQHKSSTSQHASVKTHKATYYGGRGQLQAAQGECYTAAYRVHAVESTPRGVRGSSGSSGGRV